MALVQDAPALLPSAHGQPTFSSRIPDVALPEELRAQDRLLRHSPYVETPHLLDLDTLDHENVLVAKALVRLRNVRDDYATAPYVDSFNWSQVHEELQRLVLESGLPFRRTSWYIVAFRSQIPPTTVYSELGVLDKAAHAEANASGGFLKYWFGTPDADGRNLATCVWRNREDAVLGGRGPAHRKAARATHHLYSFWKIDKHRLTVGEDAASWSIEDWTD